MGLSNGLLSFTAGTRPKAAAGVIPRVTIPGNLRLRSCSTADGELIKLLLYAWPADDGGDAHGDGENGPTDPPVDVVLLLVIGLDVTTRVVEATLALLVVAATLVTVGRRGGSVPAPCDCLLTFTEGESLEVDRTTAALLPLRRATTFKSF